jgi:very-short-patch-repair endonuclease
VLTGIYCAGMERERLEIPAELKLRMVEVAREFRRQPTRSENLLWQELRGGKLGARFRRQQPIGPFVVDFFCAAADLIVEVDGPVHEDQVARDAERQALLETCGYRVLRFSAEVVESRLSEALATIQKLLTSQAPLSP